MRTRSLAITLLTVMLILFLVTGVQAGIPIADPGGLTAQPFATGSAGPGLDLFQSATWITETVDVAEGPSSLVLDAANLPHIAYCSGGALKYARYGGSAWQIETVYDRKCVDASLALDSAGLPHIAFQVGSYNSYSIQYASYNGSSWQIRMVDDVDAGHPSLAFDSAGRPHIGYCRMEGILYCPEYCYEVRHAFYDGTQWISAVVDSGILGAPDMVLDSVDTPHFSYCHISGADHTCLCTSLQYAHKEDDAWPTEVVETGEIGSYVGSIVSIDVDAADQPSIAYDSYWDLKYAHRESDLWLSELVDSDSGRGISLRLDGSGQPQIGYGWNPLKYASYDGATWHLEAVATADYMFASPSLALDTAGFAHISYNGGGNLIYAKQICFPVAQVQIVGPTQLSAGIEAVYTATYSPITATLPTVTWSDGSTGYTHTFSSPVTGTYSIVATATNRCSQVQDSIAVTVFYEPVQGLELKGPTTWFINQAATYHAVPVPITASLPLTVTWSNGGVGLDGSYSWPMAGTFTVAATATNNCSQAQGSITVTVLCESVQELAVTGPTTWFAGQPVTYHAVPVPITTSLPLTITWSNGRTGSYGTYSWSMAGAYTVTVTGTNPCGQGEGVVTVQVLEKPPYAFFFPLVQKPAPGR